VFAHFNFIDLQAYHFYGNLRALLISDDWRNDPLARIGIIGIVGTVFTLSEMKETFMRIRNTVSIDKDSQAESSAKIIEDKLLIYVLET
jgi:hypothetical protein